MGRIQKIIEEIVGCGDMLKIGQLGIKGDYSRDYAVNLVEACGTEHHVRRPFLWDALVWVNNQTTT